MISDFIDKLLIKSFKRIKVTELPKEIKELHMICW